MEATAIQFPMDVPLATAGPSSASASERSEGSPKQPTTLSPVPVTSGPMASSPASSSSPSPLVTTSTAGPVADTVPSTTGDQSCFVKPSESSAEGASSPAPVQPPPKAVTVVPPPPPASSPVRGGKGVSFAKSAPSPAKPAKPRPRKKVPLAVYQSQISDNKLGIKLCIKKSVDVVVAKTKKVVNRLTAAKATGGGGAAGQKRRTKKRKTLDDSDSDEMNYRRRRRKDSKNNNNEMITNNNNHVLSTKDVSEPQPAESSSSTGETNLDEEQSCWALTIPENVLHLIFQYATASEGCLPTLVRLASVSSLWFRVAMQPSLWHTLDLTSWVKERYRNELKLKWFILNRMGGCRDLNLAGWKVMNVQCVLDRLAENSPNLCGLILSGWKNLMSEHLIFIATEMKNLQRIDLSGINTEMTANKTAMAVQSLCTTVQVMGERLRHLHLTNNRLGGLPQLITCLATHCPNLVLLDLSNITTTAASHAVLPVEKLQIGCPKMKIFRMTNAQITFSTATLQEQMESPGFPELEELSIASFARTICDDFVQRLLKSSTKLKLLDLRGCPRLTHDCLIRLPAWDLKHLFLSGCQITRDMESGLDLIAAKWAHSLVELDLSWGNAQKPLDNALRALAEKGAESRITHLDLCGTSVSLEAVQEVLANCPHLNSINLSSVRSLPRGMKRLMQGAAGMKDLREALGVELKVQPKE